MSIKIGKLVGRFGALSPRPHNDAYKEITKDGEIVGFIVRNMAYHEWKTCYVLEGYDVVFTPPGCASNPYPGPYQDSDDDEIFQVSDDCSPYKTMANAIAYARKVLTDPMYTNEKW